MTPVTGLTPHGQRRGNGVLALLFVMKVTNRV
jgi:hypothetical protein